MGNSVKTAVLLAALTALIILIGHAVGGREGIIHLLRSASSDSDRWHIVGMGHGEAGTGTGERAGES